MSKNSTVSVIIPTYNRAHLIGRAIQSVLNQTYRDFEIIVVDDGSTDNTGDIIKKYLSDSRVKYIYQENFGNKGFGIDKVINKAIELTNGKFICFAPGDDVSIPNRLELQINKFRLDPSIDIVFSDMWIIDEKSQVIAQKYLPEFSFTSNSFLRLLFKINLVTAPTVMMKRKCIEKVGLFEQGLVSDYHYWLKSAKVLNFKFIKTPLVKYCIHQKSLSRAPENRDFLVSETIRILKLMRKYYTICDLYPEIRYCKDKNRALSNAYLDFGNILLTGNFPIPDLAIKEFTKSLKHHPNLAALNNLGIAMILDGKIKGGITFLNKALKQFGPNDKLLSNLNSATQMLDGMLSPQFHLLIINSKESELKKTIDLYEQNPQQNPHHIEKRGYYNQQPKNTSLTQKTKILFVVHNFPPEWYAGVEVYTYCLARVLLKRGHEVSVLYPSLNSDMKSSSPILEKKNYRGINVYRLLVNSNINDSEIEKLFIQLIKDIKVSIVHFEHIQSLPFSLLKIAKELGCIVCLTLHDFWFICPRTHLYIEKTNTVCEGPETVDKCVHCMLMDFPDKPNLVQKASFYYNLAYRSEYVKLIFHNVDFISAPSKFLAEKYIRYGYGKNKIKVLPLGLKTVVNKKAKTESTKLTFGYIGTIHKLKNVGLLINAFKKVKGNAKLIIWGNGQSEEIKKIKNATFEDDRIEYRGGYTPKNLTEILSEVDIGIIPSLIENYPLTVREFLSAGIPVIASKTGGIPEIVRDGINGILFNPTNEKELCRILQNVVNNPQLIKKLREGITPIKTIEEDAIEWESIYKDLIKKKDKCDISIIIPVFNKLEFTKQCLDALYEVTPNHLFELIIVNNASTDGTKEFLNEFAKTYPNVKVIHNQENLGFAKACNQGARAAKGKYLVFLNNDTIPLKDWLEEMLKIIETEKNVGIVGSKLLYPNNTIQHAGVAIADFLQSIYPYHIHRKSPADAPEVNVVKDYQAVTGACMLIPKGLFDRLGGFDEGFLNGYEDVDLCFQVREAGYRVVYTPKSVLYHFESISEGRFKAEKENEKRLQEKWAGKIKPDIEIYLPKVSVIILNYNNSQDTIKCLESIYKNIKYKRIQVIVIDNGSKTEDVLILKKWFNSQDIESIFCHKGHYFYNNEPFKRELIFIENQENLGFAGGNNIGIKYALNCGADYVWLLNNDIIIDKDALIELIKLAEIDKKIGMVSSKLYCYHELKKVHYNGEKIVYEGMEDVKGELPKPTNFATGCSLLMRRKFIENVGLLDEDYFLYFEDNDISTRALKAGWKVYYNPYSKIYHKGGASVGGWLKTPLSVYYATRNLLLYCYKHDGSKISEIFGSLKCQIFPQLNGDRKKIYAFSQGIEDFIFNKKGKTDIDFKNISEVIKKIEREKSEIEESLKNLFEIGTKEKFYLIKNAFILKSDEYLNKFFNLARVLFLKESYKKDKKEVDYYHQAEVLYNNGQERSHKII